MTSRQARDRARLLTEARGARVACRARGNRDEGDDDNHQELVMGGVPPVVFGGAKFM